MERIKEYVRAGWGWALILVAILLPLDAWAVGQTIQQIKAAPQAESLGHFLGQLPSSLEAQVLYGLMIFNAVGMMAHYLRRWLSDEIVGSVFSYMFLQHPKATVMAFTAVMTLDLGLIQMGAFATPDDVFVGWINVMAQGLTLGYSADSVANKATPVDVRTDPPKT